MFLRNKKGFTLVELLVVISIIGLLAGMIIVNITVVRQKSRDSKRKADLASIQAALEMYNDQNSSYPMVAASCANVSSYLQSKNTADWVASPVITPEYISILPKDPINRDESFYGYCSNGTDYKLIASNMESKEGETWAREDGGPLTKSTCPYNAGTNWCAFELYSPGAKTW